MIRLIGVVGKLFVLDLESDTEVSIMLSGGDVKDIDENICNLKELKYIDMSVKTKRVLMSIIDIAKVTSRISELEFSGGGGDAPVKSVNTEIGDVVLDASKIKVADGNSIEEEFSQLASVAYSGDYLDLINRPQGSGPSDIPSPSTIASNLQSSTTEVVNGTTLSVKRSTDANNSLELRSNGLYVPPVVAPTLDTSLPSVETGKAPSSYTVYNAFNSNTLRMSGSKGEVKLSVSAGNRLVDSGAGLYVGPEPTAPIATVIDPSVHSAVSSSTVYNALTSDTISFTNPKAKVKIENPATSSVQINTSVNGISAVLKNIVKLGSVRETVSYSGGSGYRYLSVNNCNVFVIDCSGYSGTVFLNGLNDLDGDQAKTITIIVKNTTALTWASEFAWVDNIQPTLHPSTTLVVTGVYASNASNTTYTGGKVLCTFSYFII